MGETPDDTDLFLAVQRFLTLNGEKDAGVAARECFERPLIHRPNGFLMHIKTLRLSET